MCISMVCERTLHPGLDKLAASLLKDRCMYIIYIYGLNIMHCVYDKRRKLSRK